MHSPCQDHAVILKKKWTPFLSLWGSGMCPASNLYLGILNARSDASVLDAGGHVFCRLVGTEGCSILSSPGGIVYSVSFLLSSWRFGGICMLVSGTPPFYHLLPSFPWFQEIGGCLCPSGCVCQLIPEVWQGASSYFSVAFPLNPSGLPKYMHERQGISLGCYLLCL